MQRLKINNRLICSFHDFSISLKAAYTIFSGVALWKVLREVVQDMEVRKIFEVED